MIIRDSKVIRNLRKELRLIETCRYFLENEQKLYLLCQEYNISRYTVTLHKNKIFSFLIQAVILSYDLQQYHRNTSLLLISVVLYFGLARRILLQLCTCIAFKALTIDN